MGPAAGGVRLTAPLLTDGQLFAQSFAVFRKLADGVESVLQSVFELARPGLGVGQVGADLLLIGEGGLELAPVGFCAGLRFEEFSFRARKTGLRFAVLLVGLLKPDAGLFDIRPKAEKLAVFGAPLLKLGLHSLTDLGDDLRERLDLIEDVNRVFDPLRHGFITRADLVADVVRGLFNRSLDLNGGGRGGWRGRNRCRLRRTITLERNTLRQQFHFNFPLDRLKTGRIHLERNCRSGDWKREML